MKPKSEKTFLKYGEKIILVSSRQNLYLGSRGIDFDAGFYAKCKKPYLVNKFSLYPNLDEIVFEIRPNLNYESLLECNECSHTDPNKKIFEKRMKLEHELNEAKIEEHRGKHIKLGSTVQIFHPNSNTYLSFSTQQMAHSEMGVIGCSTETKESVQFIISSPFDFLKEGSLISYEDKFIFTDAYNKTLAYPLSQEELNACRLSAETKLEKGIMGLFDTSVRKEKKLPGIVENQRLFEGYQAGYVTEKSIGTAFFNQFEALNIESYFDDNDLKENDIKWGDIVTIRKVDSSGRHSLVMAEVNKASYRNAVLYRHFHPDSGLKLINIESQFQLIHVTMRSTGGTITFDKFNTASVLVKHVLSGKFLWLDPVTRHLALSPDFEDALDYLKNNKKEIEKEYGERYNAYLRLKESKKFEEVTKKDSQTLTQVDIDYYQHHGKTLFISDEDYFLAYTMLHTFVLEKVSSDESLSLNNSSFLKIRTPTNQFLSIREDETRLSQLDQTAKTEESSINFDLNFYREMRGKMSHETIVETDSFDIFHFEKSDKELVRRFVQLNSFTAFISKLVDQADTKQFVTLQFISILRSILDICRHTIAMKKLPKATVQLLLVQTSLVDLLMDYLVKIRATTKDIDDNLSLLTESSQRVLDVLSLACEHNAAVCTYIFQWRHFFTTSIVKSDSVVIRQINIDSLLFQVVDVLKCYSVYIDDYLSNLCSSIRFEQLDMKKLSILLQITKNFQNLQDTVSVSKVFEKIFSPAHKADIFKRLEFDRFDRSKVFFSLGKDTRVYVDDTFPESQAIYEYFVQTLNLAVYLGELDPAKTAKNLADIYPKDVCIVLVTTQSVPATLRAVFLKLFALLYIISHFNNSGLVSYEELVTSRESDVGRKFSETFKSIQRLKETEENKNFLNNLLDNLNTTSNELALASLKIFNILIGYKFFDSDYIMMIKSNFEDLILHADKIPASTISPQPHVDPTASSPQPPASPTAKDIKVPTKPDQQPQGSRTILESVPALPALDEDDRGFRFEDPATMIEIVDMLIKLHRSLLRFKILSVIKEKRIHKEELKQPAALQPDAAGIDAALHQVFDESFSKYIDDLMRRNEHVWEVVSDWIRVENAELSSKVLRFIHESSLIKYFFLEKYSEFYQVEEADDELIYNRLRAYLKSFANYLTDLMSEYTTSDAANVADKTLKILADAQSLFEFLFVTMDANDRLNKFELSVKEARFFRPKDLHDIVSQEVYINVLNTWMMDCQRLKSKQNIMQKCGLLEIVMKLAICFYSKIFKSFPALEHAEVRVSAFEKVPEFFGKPLTTQTLSSADTRSARTAAVTDKDKRPTAHVADELNLLLVMFLYYAVATNSENTEFVMSRYENDLHDFMLRSLGSGNQVVKHACICLLIELYKDNLKSLLKLRHKNRDFFDALLKVVSSEMDKKNYAVLINYVELFEVLTHYNDALLEENAKDIFNCLFNENMAASSTALHLLNRDTVAELTAHYSSLSMARRMDFSQTRDGTIFSQEMRDLDDMDERNNIFTAFDIHDKLLFVSDLLALVALFGRSSSIDFKTKMQKKLAMNSLIEIATAARFNYYLKENAINCLNNIFITAKIDQNSKSFILDLVSTVLVPDVKEYFRNKTNNLNAKEVYFINRVCKANHILLEGDLRQPSCSNCLVFLNSQYLVSYIGRVIRPFFTNFLQVCSNDEDTKVAEGLYEHLEDMIDLKEQVEEIFKEALLNQGPELSPDAKPRKVNQASPPKLIRAKKGDKSPRLNNLDGLQRASPSPNRRRLGTPKGGGTPGSKLRLYASKETMNEDVTKILKSREVTITEEQFDNYEEFAESFNHRIDVLLTYFQKEDISESKTSQRKKCRSLLAELTIKSKSKIFENEKMQVFFDNLTSVFYLKYQSRVGEININGKKGNKNNQENLLKGFTRSNTRKKSQKKRNTLLATSERNMRLQPVDSPDITPVQSPSPSVKGSQKSAALRTTPKNFLLQSESESKDNLLKPLPEHNKLEMTEYNPESNQQNNLDEVKSDADKKDKHKSILRVKAVPKVVENKKKEEVKVKKVVLQRGGQYVSVGVKQYQISALKIKVYLTQEKFEDFLYSTADVLVRSDSDAESIIDVLSYWTYLLNIPTFVPLLLPAIRDQGACWYLMNNLQIDRSGDSQNIKKFSLIINLINQILTLDTGFREDFLAELLRSQDNKILNNYFSSVKHTFQSLFELEKIHSQFEKENPGGLFSLFGIDMSVAVKKQSVWDEIQSHTKILQDLLQFPQLMCIEPEPIIQNYLRTQKVNGVLRPMQINIFDVLRDILKDYLKIMQSHNMCIVESIFNLLMKLVQGPCKENQREFISRKLIGVVDEIYSYMYHFGDSTTEKNKCKAMSAFLKLKIGVIESTTDTLLIKTLGVSLNSELLWSRLEQIYCVLFSLKSGTRVMQRENSIGVALKSIKKLLPEDELGKKSSKNKFFEKFQQVKDWKILTSGANTDLILEGNDYSAIMKEGLNIIIWMSQMGELDPDIRQDCTEKHEALSVTLKHLPKASAFFQSKIKSVEVLDKHKTLQTIYFYIHPICEYLSTYTQSQFEEEVDRRTSNSKLLGLVEHVEHMYYSMKHFEKISKYGIKASLTYLYRTKLTAFLLSLLLNFIILVDSTQFTLEKLGAPAFRIWSQHQNTERVVFLMAWLIFAIYGLLLIIWLAFEYNVKKDYFSKIAGKSKETALKDSSSSKKSKRHQRYEKYLTVKYHIQVWYGLVFNTELIVILCWLLTCLLAISTSKFWFSILLLDIVSLSPLIRSIIKSLTLNFKALVGTAIFGFILLFIYSSFLYFYSDYIVSDLSVISHPRVKFCETFPMCYLNVITFGLRSGGGVGDVMELPDSRKYRQEYVIRTFFDIFFWVIVVLLLLNIVLGIIIDSFAELRDKREQIENDKSNICYICNLSKSQFHSSSLPFDTHILKVHNLWNYYYYIVLLLEKNPADMIGIDSEIYWKYKNADLSWFPLHQTKNLVHKTEEEVWTKERLAEVEAGLDLAIKDKIDSILYYRG